MSRKFFGWRYTRLTYFFFFPTKIGKSYKFINSKQVFTPSGDSKFSLNAASPEGFNKSARNRNMKDLLYKNNHAYNKGYEDGLKEAVKWIGENIENKVANEFMEGR